MITTKNGNVIKQKKYEAFGNLKWSDGTYDDNREFTGKEKDPTGFHYFGARYYSGDIGRFLSPDPHTLLPGNIELEDPQELNPYVYCTNDPLKFVDPNGKFKMYANWYGTGLGGWTYQFEFTSVPQEYSKYFPVKGPLQSIPIISDIITRLGAGEPVERRKGNLLIELTPFGKLKNMEATSDPKLAKLFCGMFADQKAGVYSTGVSEKETRGFFEKALQKAESDPKLAKSLKELYGIEKIEDVDKLMEQARENYMESLRYRMSEMGGWEPQNQ